MKMNSSHRSLLVLATLSAALIAGIYGQECNSNCTNGQKCHGRNVAGQPNYVCECNVPYYMGFDCLSTSSAKTIETCYGEDCGTGNFSSPNYHGDGGYSNGESSLYLIYIPRATEIHFRFGTEFQIERRADELYVGQGLSIPYLALGVGNDIPKQYFFDGFGPPKPFTVFNDTAWIYFVSDDGGTYRGFQIFWNATVADLPPTTTPQDSHTSSDAPQTSFKFGLAFATFTSLVSIMLTCLL